MNIWKVAATTLVLSIAFGVLLELAPPHQRQMLLCSVTPNCVYVMGVTPSADNKEQ